MYPPEAVVAEKFQAMVLMPPCQALIAGEEFSSQWPPGGPWKEPEDA